MLRHPDDDADPAKRGRSSYKILVIYIYIYICYTCVGMDNKIYHFQIESYSELWFMIEEKNN